MTQKVRKQLYIEARQEKMLKRLSKEQGVSEAELIRRGLDMVLIQGMGCVSDPQAWEEELAFIRERAKIPALGAERTWTREELYDERLSN